MPRSYSSVGRTEDLTSAMITLIDRYGVGGLSLRGACRVSGTSTASALNHYGGWERLRRLYARHTWDWRQSTIPSGAHHRRLRTTRAGG